MKISIENDNQKIVLSTEGLNTLNYVDIHLFSKDPDSEDIRKAPYELKETMFVPMYELVPAIQAFEEARKNMDKRT